MRRRDPHALDVLAEAVAGQTHDELVASACLRPHRELETITWCIEAERDALRRLPRPLSLPDAFLLEQLERYLTSLRIGLLKARIVVTARMVH